MFSALKKYILQTAFRKTASFRTRVAHDIGLQLQFSALEATAKYVEQFMFDVQPFGDKFELLKHAMKSVTKDGLFLEFGVFEGQSINFIAKHVSRDVHGFDSFEGLPEHWRPGYKMGTFSLRGNLPRVRTNVILHKGWFDKTLPEFVTTHPQEIAFVHIDCDLRSSTKTILDTLGPRLSTGTVMVFDEYFNHPRWELDEYRAFQEFCKGNGASYKYIGYTKCDQQVALVML